MLDRIFLKHWALGFDDNKGNKLLATNYKPLEKATIVLRQYTGLSARKSEQVISMIAGNSSAISYSYEGLVFSLIKSPKPIKPKYEDLPIDDKQAVFMGETDVTQGLFEAIMFDNPSLFKDKTDSEQRPVESISWYESIMFCNRLSECLGFTPYYSLTNGTELGVNGGNGFRLPTMAEWEAFARADTTNKWPGTDDLNDVKRVAWFKDNSNYETHPVAQLLPNEWGLYDMSGNVGKWLDAEKNPKNFASQAIVKGNFGSSSAGGFRIDDQKQAFDKLYSNQEKRSGSFEVGFRICQSIEI